MLIQGDCLEALKQIEDNSVDSIVTDPPYGLSFMGKHWDYDVPTVDVWREVLRVLKPGGHLLSFFGTRTYHRGVVAIEDAGFEIRDQIGWAYGSGFPKSLNIGKAVDKLQGNEREVVADNPNHRESDALYELGFQGGKGDGKITKGTSEWEGWGTALKPAWEPIVVARKPLGEKSVAENVLRWNVGGINIDGCRVGTGERTNKGMSSLGVMHDDDWKPQDVESTVIGRFPANLIHDGSPEVLSLFPGDGEKSAGRFFYAAKASKRDRNDGCEGLEDKILARSGGAQIAEANGEEYTEGQGIGLNRVMQMKNNHPTVKPTDLMRYLCRLVTPKGGTVLDPFMGSGSTGKAAKLEGFDFIGIEREPEYVKIAEARINAVKPESKLF